MVAMLSKQHINMNCCGSVLSANRQVVGRHDPTNGMEINLQLRSCGPLLNVLEGYVIRQGYAWWVKDDAPRPLHII